MCADFYNDRPWVPAIGKEIGECKSKYDSSILIAKQEIFDCFHFYYQYYEKRTSNLEFVFIL